MYLPEYSVKLERLNLIRPTQQIEPNPNSWQCPLINYLYSEDESIGPVSDDDGNKQEVESDGEKQSGCK